jgi:hypothetical protein
MSIINLSVPRDRITNVLDQVHAPHLRPLMIAVRDYGIELCVVPQGKEPFDPPGNRPTVLIVGDDMFEAKGPTAFHRPSLVRFVKRCRAAVIVAAEPVVPACAAAATMAAIGLSAIIVETQPEHEADWKAALDAINPDLDHVLCTTRRFGGVQ